MSGRKQVAMDKEKLDGYLKTATEAAIKAGKFLAGYDMSNLQIKSSRGKDVKISADLESEGIILDFLKTRADIAILSEETGIIESAKEGDLRWIVDPLDGSINFLKGIPVCCVSIALFNKSIPLLGAIYDFNRDELFTGITGMGAWMNGRAIAVSNMYDISQAVLFTGVPPGADLSTDAFQKYVGQIRAFKKLRWIGSAALSLAYVAAGRADAYMENGVMLWDVAAGLAIVSGATGKYYISEEKEGGTYNVCAANKPLFNQLSRWE
jgi:myo-inositol-1(or 4)-monophosphatase